MAEDNSGDYSGGVQLQSQTAYGLLINLALDPLFQTGDGRLCETVLVEA